MVFKNCDFSHCKFERVFFENVRFEGCLFTEAVFVGCIAKKTKTFILDHCSFCSISDYCGETIQWLPLI